MHTLNTIIKEVKELPLEQREELYHIIHSINPKAKQQGKLRKKILSYAGAFSDMNEKDYSEFVESTHATRAKFFTRTVEV